MNVTFFLFPLLALELSPMSSLLRLITTLEEGAQQALTDLLIMRRE